MGDYDVEKFSFNLSYKLGKRIAGLINIKYPNEHKLENDVKRWLNYNRIEYPFNKPIDDTSFDKIFKMGFRNNTAPSTITVQSIIKDFGIHLVGDVYGYLDYKIFIPSWKYYVKVWGGEWSGEFYYFVNKEE